MKARSAAVGCSGSFGGERAFGRLVCFMAGKVDGGDLVEGRARLDACLHVPLPEDSVWVSDEAWRLPGRSLLLLPGEIGFRAISISAASLQA